MSSYNKLNNVGDDFHHPTKLRHANGRSTSNRIPLRARHINVDIGQSMKDTEKDVKFHNGNSENNYRTAESNRNCSTRDYKGSKASTHQSSIKRTKASSQIPSSDENLIIEEYRRSPKGEGHTIHKYIRGKLLGKGGFAKVYLCKSMDTKRSYAIKIVPKTNLVKARARAKLQTEIKIHRTLKHQNICEYKHFFEDKNNCYILLELCQNQSMNELIKRRKRLTEAEVKYYMIHLIDAVRYMHENNVIHRDLKLGNLFIDKYLQIKVGDLGLASKLSSSDEKRKTICGTPNYIAPEVIDGNKETRGHSFEVDIWSMGVILFTTLVGKPPYESKDVKSTYQRILANKYTFPSHIPLSPDARDLISRMLQTRPEKRPPLDQIRSHPFFTSSSGNIPHTLPQSSMHVAPEWEEDEFGNLVCVESKSTHRSRSKELRTVKVPTRRKVTGDNETNTQTTQPLNPTRQPLTDIKESNNLVSRKKDVRQVKETTTRQFMKGNKTSSLARANNFFSDINDDCERETVPSTTVQQASKENRPLSRDLPTQHSNSIDPYRKRTEMPRVEEIAQVESKMREITIRNNNITHNTKTDTSDKFCPETCVPEDEINLKENGDYQLGKGSDNDMKALEDMHARLSDIFTRVDQTGVHNFKMCKPENSSCPSKWVTRYVDYTSKYGLGFLLNDGSAGVYFNDSTKTVIAPEGDGFVYVERKKNLLEDGTQEQVIEEHTLTSYPDSLQKKVTLLKHFRNYLIEQQKRENDESYHQVCEKEESGATSLVYLKKWVRTKHAILFRLSNRTVQVIFYDHSEILLSADGKLVSYVDKRKQRNTYHLDEIVMGGAHADIKKRLKYTKDILNQLTSSVTKS